MPFTPEGYETAKSILKEHYGNDSKVEKAYVEDILELPKVSGNQPPKNTSILQVVVLRPVT